MFTFFRAFPDLFWSFFPIFVVVAVLALFGKLDQLAARSDLILGAAVLYADGWWKLRQVLSFSKAALEFVGFVGALAAIFLSTIMLLVEIGGIQQLATIIENSSFFRIQIAIELTAVAYALRCRAVLYQHEDWKRDYYHELGEKVRKLEEREKERNGVTL